MACCKRKLWTKPSYKDLYGKYIAFCKKDACRKSIEQLYLGHLLANILWHMIPTYAKSTKTQKQKPFQPKEYQELETLLVL